MRKRRGIMEPGGIQNIDDITKRLSPLPMGRGPAGCKCGKKFKTRRAFRIHIMKAHASPNDYEWIIPL